MQPNKDDVKIPASQQRVVKLLFKFRFISSKSLAQIMSINQRSAHEFLEQLIRLDLVTKVYDKTFRFERKPAYYYLSKKGVTTVRKIINMSEPAVHALYKNDSASEEFIEHCLTLASIYPVLIELLPVDTDVFTKTEISRFSQFPRNRPDLYIRTSNNQEAMVVLASDLPPYIMRKRLEEILTHFDKDSWEGDYPRICFILKNEAAKQRFLYTARRKLEHMGYDEEEIVLLAAPIEKEGLVWSSVWSPKHLMNLFE
jgi:hypothetical protein